MKVEERSAGVLDDNLWTEFEKMFCYFTWNQYDIKGYAEENYHLDVFHN